MKRAALLLVLLYGLPACVADPEPDPGPVEAPVAEYLEPAELEVDQWLIGLLDDTGNDVVRPVIEAGDFELPDEGTDADGTRWIDMDVGDNGSIGTFNDPYYYAVADLDEPQRAGDRVIARTMSTYGTWLGSVMQP